MLQNELDRNLLLDAVTNIIDKLDPGNSYDRGIIQKGMRLNRDGNVYNVKSEFGAIEANVMDEQEVFFACVDLDIPSASSCDCLCETYCEHMIAILFYCSSIMNASGSILEAWREKERLNNALAHVKKASTLLEKKDVQTIAPDDWYGYFEQRFIEVAGDNPHFVYQIFHSFYQKVIADKPKEKGLGDLYCLNAALFSVGKVLSSGLQQYSYAQYMMQQRLDELVSEIEAIPPTKDDLGKEHFHFLELTKEQVGQLLDADERYFSTLYTIYQLVWMDHLRNDTLIEEQIQFLQAELERGVHGDLLHYELAHLYFLQGNDQETLMQLEQLESFELDLLLMWVGFVAEEEQWERMTRWLTFCHHFFMDQMKQGAYMRSTLETYFLIYERYAHQVGVEGYEQSLQAFLPYSFDFYTDFLLDEKDFKGWAELYMVANRNPLLHTEVIKFVEKQQREVLIPLYHYYIEEQIQEKNRKSYKMAVRYLKKLRTIYKKEKKVDLWEQYTDRLTKTYSRLRALMEELRKGKIIV